MRAANRIQKGSGVYSCRVCTRMTRSTSRGDNELVGLCAECYDLAGEENYLSDHSELYSSADAVLGMILFLESKGADVSHWQDIKEFALNKLSERIQQNAK